MRATIWFYHTEVVKVMLHRTWKCWQAGPCFNRSPDPFLDDGPMSTPTTQHPRTGISSPQCSNEGGSTVAGVDMGTRAHINHVIWTISLLWTKAR